jgi:hydroxyacylglutathione hydrolase
VDTRHKNKVAQGFIPGSINIQGNNAFANWAGWLLNYEEQFMLVAEPEQMEDLTRKLMRIGLDNIYGFVSDVDGLGIELEKMNNITRAQLISMRELQDIQILDVRGLKEYQAGHIDGATQISWGE